MSKASQLKNVKWHKVSAPAPWHPKDGEELIGYYGGRTTRQGAFGQYDVVLVLVPFKGAFMVSGTRLIQLVDAAMLGRGDAMRIVYLGKKQLEDDREMKLFELYIGELPTADDMPAEDADEAQPS